jgi:eukaryotic-like serine/threonine-protein kinase
MSPEQVVGTEVDHRSDIFSLGVVLYEMLTRSRLFAGEDTPQIFYNVTNVQPAPPSRLNPEVPPMLDLVLERALKKDPAARYQDAFDLAADLRSCMIELIDREGGASSKKKSDRDATKTLKLEADPGKASLPPPAGSIGSDTRLPTSLRFDGSAAISRLKSPTRRDRALLTRPPRRVGLLRRIRRDPASRLLFAALVVAAFLAGAIAFA